MVSSGQSILPLAFGVHRGPKNADPTVLRQIESPAHALRVSMRAGHFKAAYIAACIGKSESYVCRLRKGRQPIPEKLVDALCSATGSRLLRQFLDMQAAMLPCPKARDEQLAEAIRSAA
jgi:hypothetical protein